MPFVESKKAEGEGEGPLYKDKTCFWEPSRLRSHEGPTLKTAFIGDKHETLPSAKANKEEVSFWTGSLSTRKGPQQHL